MDKENVNIGIIGLGFMAVMHIRAYRQVKGANIAGFVKVADAMIDQGIV